MKAYLDGGPADGQYVTVAPGQADYLIAIPRPVTVQDITPDVTDTRPTHDAVYYRFIGAGLVDITGHCSALIFRYVGSKDE